MKACVGLLATAALLGCGAGQHHTMDRPEVRAGLLVVADAVKMLDSGCAYIAEETYNAGKKDDAIALAQKCATAYDEARDALLFIQDALDTYTEAKAGKVACAAGSALHALQTFENALGSAGVHTFPPEIADGVAMAARLTAIAGGSCQVGAATDGGAG